MRLAVPSPVDSLAKQSKLVDPVNDPVDSPTRVVDGLSAGDDNFPATKQQDHDLGVIHPVDQPGELLGFVLDILEPEADRQGVEVEAVAQIRAGNDVLDGDLRGVLDRNTQLAELLEDDIKGVMHVADAFRAGTDDLARPKDQRGSLWLLGAVDKPREVVGVEIRPGEISRESLKIKLLIDPR